MLNSGLARSHVKYVTLGMSPNDDNASLLPYLRDGSAYFAILTLLGSSLFVKTKKIYIQGVHKVSLQFEKIVTK